MASNKKMNTSIAKTGAGNSAAQFTHIELHLSPEATFTNKGFAKRVQEAGGKYSHVRGDKQHRYVHLPLTAVELIETLLALFYNYKRTTVIFRGEGTRLLPSWVAVQYVPNDQANPLAYAIEKRDKALATAKRRGWA